MTQADLARLVGVARQTIVEIEKGKNPSLDLALRIAKVFDATVEDLFVLKSAPLSQDAILAIEDSPDLEPSSGDREGFSPVDFLMQHAPLRLPVGPEFASEFFSILFRYAETSALPLRVMFDTFGPDALVGFLSIFHGSAIPVPPKAYWETRFRDIHIYIALRGISRVTDPSKWQRTLKLLANQYDTTIERVIRTFERVKKVAKEGPGSAGRPP